MKGSNRGTAPQGQNRAAEDDQKRGAGFGNGDKVVVVLRVPGQGVWDVKAAAPRGRISQILAAAQFADQVVKLLKAEMQSRAAAAKSTSAVAMLP